MGRFPITQRQKAIEWHPISSRTPPPERCTSQNQGEWGPACSSLCLTMTTSPSAPSSTSCLARTYFGAKSSSSAYIIFTPATLGTWRGDGDNLGVRHMRKGLGMQVSDEPGADDTDFHTIPVRHVCRPP